MQNLRILLFHNYSNIILLILIQLKTQFHQCNLLAKLKFLKNNKYIHNFFFFTEVIGGTNSAIGYNDSLL